MDGTARIDVDEVEFAGVDIHQIFNSASADIIGGVGNLQRIGHQLLTLGFISLCGRPGIAPLLRAACKPYLVRFEVLLRSSSETAAAIVIGQLPILYSTPGCHAARTLLFRCFGNR